MKKQPSNKNTETSKKPKSGHAQNTLVMFVEDFGGGEGSQIELKIVIDGVKFVGQMRSRAC